MSPRPPRPHRPRPDELVAAWHQGLAAGAWRELSVDAEGLQLHKPEPLLDPDAPIALRLRLGSGPSVHMVARVLEPGGGGHGPRLAFETSDPLQIYAALAMGAAGSGGQGPLEALEEELQVALLSSESQLRAAAQPSRTRTAMVMATLLLVVGAAAIGALMVS